MKLLLTSGHGNLDLLNPYTACKIPCIECFNTDTSYNQAYNFGVSFIRNMIPANIDAGNIIEDITIVLTYSQK